MKISQFIGVAILCVLPCFAQQTQNDFVTGKLTATGTVCYTTPTSANHVALNTVSYGSAAITATGSGTVTFYVSGDGGRNFAKLAVEPSTGGMPVETAVVTANPSVWQVNVAAYTHVCVLRTAGTGTTTVSIHASPITAPGR
jgi:hypothetical protein